MQGSILNMDVVKVTRVWRMSVMATAFLLIAFESIYSVLSPFACGAVPPNAMFRANLERTGVYRTRGMRRLHGVKWKFKTGRVIEAWFSSPTVSNGMGEKSKPTKRVEVKSVKIVPATDAK